ncbi:gliding motility-associated C-terminal domain-containing protein, partial [Odoribacter sp. OttesenSCG-928-G04]|nr:gliding motility-associated C-terminal domain-containing protein [Odoribacter sp. OttesenSCG-928-G04]
LGLNANGEIEVKFKELPYVTVLEAPSSVINHCSGDMLTLTGAGASSYTWTNGVQNGVPFMPSAGQYTVTGTGANGCVKSSVVTVTLTPKPTILSISASSNNICQGESIIFNAQASAGANITWSDGITNGVPYTPMTTGYPVYTATATLATAPFCSVESSVSVTVDPRTEIYYKSKSPRNIAIGKNGSFSVKARGKGLTYQWYKKESGTWMQMSNSIASQPGIAGVNTDSLILLTVPQSWDQSEFRVVVTGTCGKDSADFILGVKECFDINLDLKMGIGIIPNTDPTSNVHGYFCAGSEISMIATLSSDEDYDIVNPSFTWFIDGEKFHTEHWEIEHSVAELKWIPDVSFEDDLLVKVCAYSDGACEEVCSRFFRIKARKPQPVTFELLASKGDKYCPGDTIDFWVSTNAAGNNPTYTWYNDVYKLPLEQSPSNKLLHYENERIKLVMGQEDTWVRVTMQPSIEVCPDSAIYDRKLFMTKSQIVEPSLRIINDINDTLACIGDQITFTAIYENAGENPKLEWRKDIWDLGYGISAEATLDKDKDMWIKCILTPGPDVCFTGTSLVDTMVIRVLDNPSVTIWSDMENKAEGDLITIQSEVTDMPTDPTYTWYVNKYMAQENGDTYNSNGFREGDVVQLAVNGARVCQTVVFSNELIINFGSSSRDTVITIYKGESVQNVAMAKSDAESQDYIFTIDRNDQAMWGTASITSSGLFNYKPNTDFTGSDHVKYTMINRYDKNKVMTGVVYINVLENSKYFVPNIITPNGDGINDTWRLDFISAYPGNVVTIYNRQGKVIFRSKDYQNDWGGLGSSSGSTAHTFLPNGIYTYIIDLGNKELLKGWVEIRRDIANKGF